MTFYPVYCLFSLWCFVNESEFRSLNSKDFNGVPLVCPKSCLCYTAPKDRFGIDDTSNSMICHDEQVELFYQYFGPNIPKRPELKLNTVVLNNLRNFKETTIVLNADSVVLDTDLNLKDLTLEGNFRYLTIYGQKDLRSLPEVKSPELRGIYIRESGDRQDKTEFVPWRQSFPKLESFTIQESHIRTILSRRFISAPSLRTLDLSQNELISVDSIIIEDPKDKNDNLKHLYLNDNRLTAIPIGLIYTFPKLETLHLHGNPIKVLNYGAIKPLLLIREFVLFDPNQTPKENLEIYHYGNLLKWLPNSNTKTDTSLAMGLLDSFVNSKIICGNNDQEQPFTTIPYEPGMTFAICEEWKFHPERAYPFKGNVFHHGKLRKASIVLRGLVYEERPFYVIRPHVRGSALWIQFSMFYQKTEKDYIELRNILYEAHLISCHVILRFTDIDKAMATERLLEDMTQMLTYVLDGRPNFVGFEVEIFDASMEKISHDKNADKNLCSIEFPTEESKKKFYDRVEIYKKFTAKMSSLQSESERYLFLVTIDAKCLEIAQMFIEDDQVKKCFQDDNVQVDGIDVVNVDIKGTDYQKHKTLIQDFQSLYDKVSFVEIHPGYNERKQIWEEKLP